MLRSKTTELILQIGSRPLDVEDLDEAELLLEDKRTLVPTDPELEWLRLESLPFNRDNLMTINRRSIYNWNRPRSGPRVVVPYYRIGDGINYRYDGGIWPSRFGSFRSRLVPYHGSRPF